ncbi:hypothetical protein GCM10023189_57440 [Nibrella saemangeumensis]|uniref:Uncharacterized protein n=1 Tax=Nibrella saemangeumensis TaxID=1084526 RepID=A0ABP8NQX5_9BACT
MQTVKVTKYSYILPELQTSLGLLLIGRIMLLDSMDSPSGKSRKSKAALRELEEKIDLLTDEINVTELLHEAALLVGDYKEFRNRKNSSLNPN